MAMPNLHRTCFFYSAVLASGITLADGLRSAQAAERTGAIVCEFTNGAVQTFERNTFKPESAARLAFRIENIDVTRQTAELVTDQGRGELRVVRAIAANHFLEVVNEGFLNMTTIYDAASSDKPMPAVHSRHLAVVGQPVVAQYTGSCRRQGG